jgi:hypothetical protein
MVIELPQEAKDYINDKGDELLEKLQSLESQESGNDSGDGSIEHLPKTEIDKEDMEVHQVAQVNILGEETSKGFQVDDETIGLIGDSLEEFKRVVKNFSERNEFRDYLSRDFIDEKVFEWIKRKYLSEIDAEVSLSEHLLAEASKAIQEQVVSFPIEHLFIEKPFVVGKVQFNYLRKETFDEMVNVRQKRGIQSHKPVDDLREKFQGRVIASFKVKAEQQKAIEIGKREVQKSLVGLRFFSKSAFISKRQSVFGFYKTAAIPSYHSFIFKGPLPDYVTTPTVEGQFFWGIGESEIEWLQRAGMFQVHELLKKQDQNDFEETLLNCLFLFDKSLTASELQDKLVFLNVCLETLLLKDAGEPIKKSVGQRFAYLATDETDDRKELITSYSEIYDLRSKYIHHGRKTKVDYEKIDLFQQNLWNVLSKALRNRERFEDNYEFIKHIDDSILTGDSGI